MSTNSRISIERKLSVTLGQELKNADEIWVAVGLLNMDGLNFILNRIPERCKLNFVVGVDLPTDPRALLSLIKLKIKRKVVVKVLTEEFFHPKVYVTKSNNKYTAFVGSANCTKGGLDKNIEITLHTTDSKICNSLLTWFDKSLITKAEMLDADFIAEYKPQYDKRLKRINSDKKETSDFKKKEKLRFHANIIKQDKLMTKLKRYRSAKDYLEVMEGRRKIVDDLRKCLDYPRFETIDLKTFFSIKELGTIVAIRVKKKIINNPQKFTALMKFICDDTNPIGQRIDEALSGKVGIDNIGKGFITKVLVMHNPKLYYLHNDFFNDSLRPFGLSLPKGLTFGKKYELTRDILEDLLKKTNIDDFATLDAYLWRLSG